MKIVSLGLREILALRKTTFFCSRDVSPSAILKCYDWAIEQRDKGICIISGFHSKIEKDVFHYLLTGKQPVIMVLARGMYKRIPPDWLKAIDEGRLLIITPFNDNETRASSSRAMKRNRLMIDLADEIVVGYCNPKGHLSVLLSEVVDKRITKLQS